MKQTSDKWINPWNEYGISSFPPAWPMVGLEQVRRHLESSLHNFAPGVGSSAWFALLSSIWGGGKTRTAHELISQTTGQSKGWIDRAGNALPPVLQPDFTSGLLPVMVSYKRIIRTVEAAGLKLPFTEWIPRVALAALNALKTERSPELRELRDHLQALKPAVYKALRALPELSAGVDVAGVLNGFTDTLRQSGIERLLVLVEEVEDPTEIRNKPGGVLGDEAYQEIKDTYLDVIPEVLKSDIERQKYPHLGFLLLCSPAVYHSMDRIPSQERRHYPIRIGRNTVADLCGYLNHLRQEDTAVPDYEEELIRAAYVAVDRNMGWMNVLMYAIHRRWAAGERDIVSLLREFAEADPRGKEVFAENALARIPRIQQSAQGQRLLFGQTPIPLPAIGEAEGKALLAMQVTDALGSPAFARLHPLHAELSDIIAAAQKEPGVQLISGGGAQVRAADVDLDLARVMEDLGAYATDGAGHALVPRDKDLFVAHLTALHGISQTGAAGEYLYPVFAGFTGEPPTHIGPSFAALRQLNKRFQREDFQSRLLEDDEADRDLSRRIGQSSSADRLRSLRNGLLRLLEENQVPQEDLAEEKVNVSAVGIERTAQLDLSQDGKVWLVVGQSGAEINAALESLGGQHRPVRPVVLMLAATDLNQRDLIEGFLQNRPAIRERVFFFPLAELDERLLFLKADAPADDALTNLARSLLYRLRERVRETLVTRFDQLLQEGVVVRRLFRADWKSNGDDLAELWLFLAADANRTINDAKHTFGETMVDQALTALAANRPTAKTIPEPLVDHDWEPPRPVWAAGLARMVRLIAASPKISKKGLAMRFFGDGAKPQVIVEEMLAWLAGLGVLRFEENGESVALLTRGHIEQRADAANQWYGGDFQKTITDLGQFQGLQQELQGEGANFKQQLKQLQDADVLKVVSTIGTCLGQAGGGPFDAAVQEVWRVLSLLMAFRRRQMNTEQAARGKQLATEPEILEAHVAQGTLPLRDRVDGIGAFVRNLQQKVTAFQDRMARVRTSLLPELKASSLPEVVLERALQALLMLTQLDKTLTHSTYGVTQVDTIMNSVVLKKFHQAVRRMEQAEQRMAVLENGCREWLADWKRLVAEVSSLQQRFSEAAAQISQPLPDDPVFVRNHLVYLHNLLTPQISDARDMMESMQDLIDGDYSELVRQNDKGGAAFDAEQRPIMLNAARELLQALWEGGKVSIALVREEIEKLEVVRKQYVVSLMQDRGTPSDPGLGLLRFAINRLDASATTAAQQRLEQTQTLRELIQTAYAIRQEWRTLGPDKLGDSALFDFFLQIIDATELGNKSIPPDVDWENLGKLKDRRLITLTFSN